MRGLRRFLNRTIVPRSLFGRSLLIVVLPIVVLQIVLTIIFYNRHWDTVTRWLASGVAGEVALMVEMLEQAPTAADKTRAIEFVRRHVDLAISFEPGGDLASAAQAAGFAPGWLSHIDEKIIEAFREALERPFALDLRAEVPGRIAVYVQLDDGLLRVLAHRKRVTSTTTGLLLAWMIGASTVLVLLALYYMRMQIRPIRRLAKAVDSFGKGRDVGDFEPEGAAEIKLAARAFNVMRQRILRHLGQRTEMLAAISHDLRTPLTRMRLELELLEGQASDPIIGDLKADVEEMEDLVETYLAFARGEGRESMELTPLQPILEGMRERATRAGATVDVSIEEPIMVPLRPLAFRRSLANIVDNACRYGHWIGIRARRNENHVEIAVEDDGPGIPEEKREKVLQPFVRLEQSRSRDTGGLGLGLTIARDIILGHGGDLVLSESSKGGLKAVVRLPV